MPTKPKIRIVKVPNPHRQLDKMPVFPHMPRLYLELIENKAKIKQDLIGKEHISQHRSVQGVPTTEPFAQAKAKTPPPTMPSDFDKKLDKILDDSSSDDSNSDDSSSYAKSVDSSDSDVSIEEKRDDISNASTNDLSVRLKKLLEESSDEESDITSISGNTPRRSVRSVDDKYSRHRNDAGMPEPIPETRPARSPPTLAELEQRGAYQPKRELRDINFVSMTEQEEEDVKREYLFKFELLKKSYPSANVPEYTIHSDLETVKKSYDNTLRMLSLDASVEQYEKYLIAGFAVCEFALGNFLGFDMEGFTRQQIISMQTYRTLLVELGEKSYVPTGSKWPVELRLLGLIAMNAAFFVVSKMIMKKTGGDIMGMMNNMMGGGSTPSAPARPKRKMRGPNIDLDEIPDN